MCGLDPEFLSKESRDQAREARRGRRRAVRRWLRAAVPGEVDGDHVVADGERIEHGFPHLPVAPRAVDQEQRLPAPASLVIQLNGSGVQHVPTSLSRRM